MKAPLVSRQLMVFMGTMILANIASHMYLPLLPLYVQELGANVAQVGLFFTLSSIAPLVFQILGGWLSDQVGRLQAIAIGSVAGVFSYGVFIVAPTWQWLILSVAASSMAVSFVGPSFQAFVAEQSTPETRGRVYGITTALFNVVGIIGPPIGGFLSAAYGFRVMFIVGAVFYTAATVIRVIMARTAQREKPADSKKPSLRGLKTSLAALAALIIGGGVLTWIFIVDGVRDISFGMAFQLMPLYMQNLMGLTNIEIGLLSSVASIGTMVFLSPAGWLSDKKGERFGIVAGSVFSVVSVYLFLQSRSFYSFAIVWFIFGVGQAISSPAFNSLISKVVPVHLRGTAFGLFHTSLGLVSLPSPWIGGQLWERISPKAPFFIPMVVTFLLLPVMWVKFKLTDRGDIPSSPLPADK